MEGKELIQLERESCAVKGCGRPSTHYVRAIHQYWGKAYWFYCENHKDLIKEKISELEQDQKVRDPKKGKVVVKEVRKET